MPARSHSPREVECKLDAPSLAALQKVGAFVLSDDHYVSAADPRFRPDAARDFNMLGTAYEVTGLRTRVYFDDLRLRGFRNNVEMRVEGDAKTGWKQTIKIGGNQAKANGTFDRNEYAHKLATPAPDLTLLPKKIQKMLNEIYQTADVKKIEVLPLARLFSQRLRFSYMPDGNPRQVIEYAQDPVRGQTCTDFKWDFYQIELETKKGSSSNLAAEQQRLMDQFNFLRVSRRSKPTEGFEKLMVQLDDSQTRKYLKERLKPGEFRVVRSTRFAP